MSPGRFLGIDIGGTFTDVVLAGEAPIETTSLKVLTTPRDPIEGVVRGVRALLARSSVGAEEVTRVVHATTLASNLVLEGAGQEIAYVATAGFADVPRIGRESWGPQASVFTMEKPRPPIGERMLFEVTERMSAQGQVVRELDRKALEQTVARLAEQRPVGVAVCLMNSYANPAHEHEVANAIRNALPDSHVAASVSIWPEFREFDRAMTTIASAYVGPLLGNYLGRLEASLRELGITAPIEVMQSNGGIVPLARAAERAVYCIESGPAAGVVAASYLGGIAGHPNVIAFDMGGTTAKAALVVGGEPTVTNDFRLGGMGSVSSRDGGGFPIRIPVIDLAEVGAGGGSIAWVDPGGALKVGPRSAGAEPGPACYGRGGVEPTVTDADLVLGYLDPGRFVGGEMAISVDAARAAIGRVADRLGLDWLAVAAGIHDITNANMGSAIRRITVQRGIDPRDFTLVASGGAGPVHVARVAGEFAIPRIVVPPLAGVMSALGLIASDLVSDHVRTRVMAVDDADPDTVNGILEALEREARDQLGAQPGSSSVTVHRAIEMRFRHQAHSLRIAVPQGHVTEDVLRRLPDMFFAAYRREFGIEWRDPVEIVNFRVRTVGSVPKLESLQQAGEPGDGGRARTGRRPVYFSEVGDFAQSPVYDRDALRPGDAFSGPAIVQERNSTVVVPPGYALQVDAFRNIVLTLQAAPEADQT
jgi:N-methylhydantoinase A